MFRVSINPNLYYVQLYMGYSYIFTYMLRFSLIFLFVLVSKVHRQNIIIHSSGEDRSFRNYHR
jgi:hypothetical protein